MVEVLIVAAEASSSHYALRLMRELKSRHPEIRFFGVGDVQMEKEGFERLGRSEEMAVVGLAEILGQLRLLKDVMNKLVEAVQTRRPRVIIVMDYPDFNLIFSRKIAPTKIPVYYYISPQVWAWRKGRIHKIKKLCKKVFLLFPFEIPFYTQFQVPHEFVGHPLLDEIEDHFFDQVYLRTLRNQKGISDKEIVLGLMPGSRKSELFQHMSIQLEVAKRLSARIPNLKVLIMVAPTFEREQFHPYLEDVRFPYILLKDDPFRMIALSDFVLAASGTATLQVGLLEKPMVIMYKTKWFTGFFGKLMVRGVQFFGLANLVLNKKVVSECIQEDARADLIEQELANLILAPDRAEEMRKELRQLRHLLGEKGATSRVAKSLEAELVDL